MNILVTGGAGFIGSHVVTKLLHGNGYTVTVLDNLSPQIHGDDPVHTSPLFQSLPAGIKFIHGSVTEKKDWIEALHNQHIIIHLAAETGTGQSMYEVEKYTNVNIGGTALLLDILANTKHTVRKIVLASSRAIYGEGKYFSKELGVVYPSARNEADLIKENFEVKYPGAVTPLELMATDEEAKIHPTSVYGITKQNQEQMLMMVCKALGIDAVALRFQNVYGPGQSLRNPYTGILSIFSTLINNNQALNIFEDGKMCRDFIFIDDAVEAILLGTEKGVAAGNVYNAGFGEPVDVLTVAHTLYKHYEQETQICISGNIRVGDIRHNYADIAKIKSHLGFLPKINFETGSRLFAHWVKEQGPVESTYTKSILEMKERGLYK